MSITIKVVKNGLKIGVPSYNYLSVKGQYTVIHNITNLKMLLKLQSFMYVSFSHLKKKYTVKPP